MTETDSQPIAENEQVKELLARIDAFSTEYHEMGRHLKNMGRTLQGKPAEADARKNGKIARAFKGAFKVEGALISSLCRKLGPSRFSTPGSWNCR